MLQGESALGRARPSDPANVERAIERFRQYCQFEPETGCVIWQGGRTSGRGHHVPYGSFWFNGRRWFAHRFAAKFIHGYDIEGLQVDHCCPCGPNTLCVEHVRPVSAELNRWLQTHRRRTFVHLQVGLLSYEDVYGPQPHADGFTIPFFRPPTWMKLEGDHSNDCPF